jgi:hypothetical protein
MAANPEAIAWYVQRSEAVLAELVERVQSVHARGGQVAGFSGAVLALAGANAESTLSALHGLARTSAGCSLLAGFLLLIAAFVTALRGAAFPARDGAAVSAAEVANYATDRFIQEPDLWRVQLRTIGGLRRSIVLTGRQSNRVTEQIGRAERFFVAGLSLVGVALAILVATEML